MSRGVGVTALTERVQRTDPAADAESIAFAADFVRLVLHTLGADADPEDDDAILRAALGPRTGLSEAALSTLLVAARAPREQAGVGAQSLRAFGARFGRAHAALLEEETRGQIDLPTFAVLHGTAEALLLLDTLFAVAARRGGAISRKELEDLRAAARELSVDEVLVTALLRKHAAGLVEADRRVVLGRQAISIGRASTCDICLADPQVALIHAEVQPQVSGGWRVVDQASGRPTLLNGAPVTSAPLREGAVLQIAHFKLQLVVDEQGSASLMVEGERSFSSLSVRHLRREIGEVSLLDDVSFTVFTGEVVAVVGPSGAGKTTLLHAISAVTPADSGDVLLDGNDFHRLLGADRSLVGIVPQDDLVHSELTVGESLAYSGRLRFQGDVDKQEVNQAVGRVLDELDIAHIREQRIGDALRRGISGGQRKRVNLGQELMSRSTRVLFLDEPTSGLDPRASQDIVRLVRQLADRGRIIFLVTHDLTPEVLAQVDHLLVLVPGGRVAFFGPPKDAARYFQVRTPDAIFNRFGDHSPETWAALFKESEVHRKYVVTRDRLLGVEGVDRGRDAEVSSPRLQGLRHLRALTSRYALTRLRDATGMAVLGVQPVILALVMSIVFPEPTDGFLFMLSLSCLWFGMSASVRELIADRAIWRREARIGVGVGTYVASKVLVLGTAVVGQCVFLAGVLYAVFGLGDYGHSPALLAAVSSLIGLMGMSVGLFVSSVWTSSEAAVGTLPLLLIPQITFSGILVGLRDMTALAKGLTHITVQRYAYNAVIRAGEEVAVRTTGGDYKTSTIRSALYRAGFKPPAEADNLGLTLAELSTIMGSVTIVLLTATVAIVAIRTRRANR